MKVILKIKEMYNDFTRPEAPIPKI